jgi:hypothetical protein
VGAASAEIRASDVAREAALQAKDVEGTHARTLEMLERLDHAEGPALRKADSAALSAERAELTTALAQAATLETLQRLDRTEAALRTAALADDLKGLLPALAEAADQGNDLKQALEDLAVLSGEADSDGDGAPDMSIPRAQPGEVDSDGDGIADMSVLQAQPGEELAPLAPGEADSDGDGIADMSVLQAQPGEVDSDGDGVADMSAAPEADTAVVTSEPSEASGTPEFDMEAYHRTKELQNGSLSDEALDGEAAPEVEPGTGPLSNEAIGRQTPAGQDASGDEVTDQSESPSPAQSYAPSSDELHSVSEQYSPASDELEIENGSGDGETDGQQEDGPYGPASDELDATTEGAEEQVESEPVEFEQVETEPVESEQAP